MSSAVDGKYIAYRHVGNGMHPAWTFPAAGIACHIPVALAEAIVLGTITYFMAGLTYEAARFFYFLLVMQVNVDVCMIHCFHSRVAFRRIAAASSLTCLLQPFFVRLHSRHPRSLLHKLAQCQVSCF